MTLTLKPADCDRALDHDGMGVLVHSGAYRERCPVAGWSVAAVKRSLRDVGVIPYFCLATVNGVAVSLATLLRPGDRLHFRHLKGFKAADDTGPTEAERLFREYPELRALVAGVEALGLDRDRGIEVAVVLTWQFFFERFGPFPERERAVLADVVRTCLPERGGLTADQETDPLARIEWKIDQLLRACQVKEWYTTEDVAARYGKDVYTVREWCRLGRVKAEKVQAGRGCEQEWRISQQELLRYEREGLRSPAGPR